MELFSGFTWPVPRAFASAVAACRFEQGDVLYDDARAYTVGAADGATDGAGTRWGDVAKELGHAIQVLDPPRSARGAPAEASGRRFDANWASPVTLELVDFRTGQTRVLETTQARLFTCLWRGSVRTLEGEPPENVDEKVDEGLDEEAGDGTGARGSDAERAAVSGLPVPETSRALHGAMPDALAVLRAEAKRLGFGGGHLFAYVVDESSDASLARDRAVRAALEACGGGRAMRLAPGTAVPGDRAFHPALWIGLYAFDAADDGPAREALKAVLYAPTRGGRRGGAGARRDRSLPPRAPRPDGPGRATPGAPGRSLRLTLGSATAVGRGGRRSGDRASRRPAKCIPIRRASRRDGVASATQGEAFIIEAVRSPLGRRGGGLSSMHPTDLLGAVQKAAVERAGIDPLEIDQIIGGCVSQVGEQSFNIARNAWLDRRACPLEVPSTTVDSQCGSSQQASTLAAGLVGSGLEDVALSCGIEMMSRIPLGANFQTSHGRPVSKSYFDRYAFKSQFQGAEMIAEEYGITREDTDRFGLRSQQNCSRQAWTRRALRSRGRSRSTRRSSTRRASPPARRCASSATRGLRETSSREARDAQGRDGGRCAHRRQRVADHRRCVQRRAAGASEAGRQAPRSEAAGACGLQRRSSASIPRRC